MSVDAAGGEIHLQATIAAATAGIGPSACGHHPITCTTGLRLHEDGSFSCDHGGVPPGDIRTQLCIDHAIGLLLVDLAREGT